MSTATMKTDPYFSRTGTKWEATPRVDPVVNDASGPLSSEEVTQYQQDGFLFAPALFSSDEVDSLLTEAKSMAASWPEERPGLIREPNSEIVRSIFRLHKHSDLYKNLFRDERLLGRVTQLLGSEVYLHQSRINYKPALNGKEFFWHSDFETWHVEDGMPRMRAISVSLLLTESHEFNGPLMLIPGSHETYIRCAGETPENHHQQSLRRQEYGVPTKEALELLTEKRDIVAPKGPAGSIVFFECNTMHGSVGNLSPTPRINLFAVYNSVENALVDPFCNQPARPDYLAEREIEPVQ
ncbi:Multidrug DMT transporter permease [Planctomycetales bacterium 10988]|nr:Multidrug DMT transporter permease [Planctomycetales bacterium 10988]